MLARREIVDLLAVQAITDTNLNFIESVEDVEFGKGQSVNAASPHALAHQYGVEPATSPRPAGDDPEFFAAFAQGPADLIFLLGWKRPRADPGRVRLADRARVSDGARREPRPGRRLGSDRIRRSHKRIGAVVDIEKRALGAFEQDALALAAFLLEQQPHRIHVGQHQRRRGFELRAYLPRVDLVKSQTSAQRVMMRQQALDLAVERG